MCKKIFISDLHLGDGSNADDFHRDKEFLDFLTYVEGHHAELIILGDLFELWQCDLDKILWAHSEVINKLNNLKTIYIYGNHDYLPFSRLKDETYQTDKIFAQHGHQYDVLNRHRNPLFSLRWPIGKYASILLAELERWFHPDADVWANKMQKRFGKFLWEAANLQNRNINPFVNEDLWCEAYHRILDNKQKIIIFGHTHKVNLDKFFTGDIYANCGAWTDNVDPTYIEVDNETVKLKDGLNHKIIKEIKNET